MDYLIPIFGWFHLIMAFANSLHKQYLGVSSVTRSFQQAFDLLQCQGLLWLPMCTSFNFEKFEKLFLKIGNILAESVQI